MASTLTTDYVSQDVVMTWNGLPIEAYADSFVSVSYLEDHVVGTQGPDGYGSYSLLPATQGTVEITLQQESPTHKFLSGLLLTQKESRQIIRGTFLIVNPNGDSLYTGINQIVIDDADIRSNISSCSTSPSSGN